ncbi:MAG: hypothetical protein IKV92_09385 [Akkermansia sp.]|nr:hypothetical protein [Akkermansia sp.]
MGMFGRWRLRRGFRNMGKKKPPFAEEWKKFSRLDKIGFIFLYSIFAYFLFRYFLGIDLIELLILIAKKLLTGL